MEMQEHPKISPSGFSPLRAAYVLSFFIIVSVVADFFVSWPTAEAIGYADLAFFTGVIGLCLAAPRGAARRFLPVLLAVLGLAGHMLCMPL